ncbi:MAG: outer membrane protein transport protein [Bacteroidota bacterium]|nr:outer membrane protein transport protein [Bacteroidota bacterium]
MKLISTRFITMVIIFSIYPFQMYAGGFQLNEHGARAMAQGGAFAARAYDASAIYFNPAGLGFQTGGSLYVGTTLITPKADFYGPTNLQLSDKTEMVNQMFTPINVYATYSVTEDLHVGIGVNNPFGLGTEWPDNWAGKFLTEKIDLKSFFISPTVAYKISDQVSLGIGFNYVTGDVTINRYVSDPFDPHAKINLSLSGTGTGFNAGILYKISPEFSAGVSYRSSVKIEASGSATFNPNRSVYPGGDASATLTLPSTAFVGVAYKGIDHLELEADYQYVGWSTYDKLVINFKKDGSAVTSPKNYTNVYILRFGGEYTMDEWQFRFGYLFDHNPVPNAFVEPLLPDADRNGINLGVGYKINENFNIDLSYLFLKFDDRKAKNTDPSIAFDGVYRSYANLLGVNFGYTF